MKKLLFVAIIIIPFISNAQSDVFNYKREDRYLYYSDVVQVDTSITVVSANIGSPPFISPVKALHI